MKINKKPYPLVTVSAPNIRQNIDTNPDYQRPSVWSLSQKQLLIDTILRGYDIPKVYWRQTGTKPDKYEVVDGQQRLRAIWDYFDGKYGLPDDAEPIDGVEVARLRINELPVDLLSLINVYNIDVIIMEDSDEDESETSEQIVDAGHFEYESGEEGEIIEDSDGEDDGEMGGEMPADVGHDEEAEDDKIMNIDAKK
jgi:hypothetical protein